ncbi:hypothetical protein MMYC01_207952 [Madurella mycetomatis]|uniref:Uncharacterized protein n=1 Tax=Madurella mycetomatis TaxID=100816 RepID=A0A175VTX3_9PEZI|nr:hypothetical protein MMYC01_207952 [Madurella mycetomatis]
MPGAAARRRGSRRHENRRQTQKSRRPAPTTSQTHLAGVIMWLPRRDVLRSHSELPSGCYEHPVVILSPQPLSTGKVVILILTSFGETDILAKFPNKPRLRRAYLPIHPTSPHPDTALQLHLKKPAVLRRKTYANTREQHTVPFDILRSYDRQDPKARYALTSDSYKQLIHHADFAVPVCSLPSCIPCCDDDDDGDDGIVSTNISLPDAPEARPVSYLTPPATPPRLTHGTIPPVPPAPPRPSSPVPESHQATGMFSYIPPRLAPRAAHRQLVDTLPYSHSPDRPKRGGIDIGYIAKWVLALIFGAAVLGGGFFGLWSAWTHRAELGRGLLGCVSWIGLHAFRLVKGAVVGIARCVVWLVKQVAALAAKAWGWLRGGGGGVRGVYL